MQRQCWFFTTKATAERGKSEAVGPSIQNAECRIQNAECRMQNVESFISNQHNIIVSVRQGHKCLDSVDRLVAIMIYFGIDTIFFNNKFNNTKKTND